MGTFETRIWLSSMVDLLVKSPRNMGIVILFTFLSIHVIIAVVSLILMTKVIGKGDNEEF